MKVSIHVILQAMMTVVQFGTVATSMVPHNLVPYVVLIVSAAQGGLAWWNHYFSPDGTPVQG